VVLVSVVMEISNLVSTRRNSSVVLVRIENCNSRMEVVKSTDQNMYLSSADFVVLLQVCFCYHQKLIQQQIVWFCHGTTHYCERCHSSWTRIDKNNLQKCPGSSQCPIGGNHPPNGEEYALGCGLCQKH
jgi:hypothetical protein